VPSSPRTSVSPERPSALTLPGGEPAMNAWPLDPDLLHLNHGSFGAVPRVALEAQQRLRDEMEADPFGWFLALPERIAQAREELAPFLGVAADRFALVPNASAGASAFFGSLPHAPGGEIVVTEHGYGAVVMGAARVAERWGGTVRTARFGLDAGPEEITAAIAAEITPRTRAVVIDQITSGTARRLPVERIADLAGDIPVLVDGAHAPGALARPVSDADVTWVGNLHKFACAPRGTAVLVAGSTMREALAPVIDSWGAPLAFPERFDTQGTVDATGQLAAATSVRFVAQTWGWDTVRAHAAAVAEYGVRLVGDTFAHATGDDHAVDVGMPVGALRLVRLPAGLAADGDGSLRLRNRLKFEHGVVSAPTSFRGVGYLRLAPHAYSTAEHVEEFADRFVPMLLTWARQGL
jgi:isopenicillin-N epimerase